VSLNGRSTVIGTLVLPFAWFIWIFGVEGIPSGWSGIEPFYFVPPFALYGSLIGAVIGAIVTWTKSKLAT
jgi:hypothetical protein